MLSTGEYEQRAHRLPTQEMQEQIAFQMGRHRKQALLNSHNRRAAAPHLHELWIALERSRQLTNLRWQRGRKQQGLTLSGNESHDAANVWQEPHVHHAVGLV